MNSQNIQNKNEKLQIIKDDPYLESYQSLFIDLRKLAQSRIRQFDGEGGLDKISLSYHKYGIHRNRTESQSIFNSNKQSDYYTYQEWAPGARRISVFGDFNDWNRKQYQCQRFLIQLE